MLLRQRYAPPRLLKDLLQEARGRTRKTGGASTSLVLHGVCSKESYDTSVTYDDAVSVLTVPLEDHPNFFTGDSPMTDHRTGELWPRCAPPKEFCSRGRNLPKRQRRRWAPVPVNNNVSDLTGSLGWIGGRHWGVR